MIKYLIKNATTVRVETEEEADQLHKQMIQETQEKGWTLSSWKETKKERKSKGEIIEEYYQVDYTIVFSDIKEPDVVLDKIEYQLRENVWNDNQGEDYNG